MSLQAIFRCHEQAKKSGYGKCVHEAEHGVFTPLVLSTTGGLGHEVTTLYKCRSHQFETTEALLQRHVLAKVPTLIRHSIISHHVRQGEPVILLLGQDVRLTSPLPPRRVSSIIHSILHHYTSIVFYLFFYSPCLT